MIAATHINFKDTEKFHNLLDIFYPIGSIYLTVSETSPSENLGGSWMEIVDAGMVATATTDIAADTKQGSKTISTAQLPSHTHGHAGVGAGAVSAGEHTHILSTNSNYTTNGQGAFITPDGGRYASTSSGSIDKIVWHVANGTYALEAKLNGAHTHALTGSTTATGSGSDFIPYSYVCHVWKRVA